jgi:hypothetical protein
MVDIMVKACHIMTKGQPLAVCWLLILTEVSPIIIKKHIKNGRKHLFKN